MMMRQLRTILVQRIHRQSLLLLTIGFQIALINGAWGNPNSTPFQTSGGEIIWPGWQGQQRLTVGYPDIPKVRSLMANGCGVISITNTTTWPAAPQTQFRINGRTLAFSGIQTGAAPRCERGMNQTVPQFRNPRRFNQNVYIGGFEPQAKVDVAYLTVPTTRTITANACGLLIIRSTPDFPNSNLIVNGVQVSRKNLPLRPAPICRDGQLYVPQS